MTGSITINNRSAAQANCWHEATPQMAKSLAPFLLGTKAEELHAAVELSKKGKGENPERIEAANFAYMQIAAPMLWCITQSSDPRFWNEVAKLEPEHYAMIIASEENPTAWCMDIQLVKQLIPSITYNGRKYIGPRDYFKGVTFGEYLTAQARYTDWLKEPTAANLAQFFGILYRPERTDVSKESEAYADDARTPFISANIQEKAKVFEKYNEQTMLVAVLYWRGCHAQMRTKYSYIFNGTSSKSSNPGEIVISLAKSPGKEDVEQIWRAPLHNIMTKLNTDSKPPKK